MEIRCTIWHYSEGYLKDNGSCPFLMLQCSIHLSTSGVTSNHETIVAQQNRRVDWRDRDLCASGSTFSLDSFRDACGQRNYTWCQAPLVKSWWWPVATVATRVHTVAQWHTDTGYWHYWHHQNYSHQIASSPHPAL